MYSGFISVPPSLRADACVSPARGEETGDGAFGASRLKSVVALMSSFLLP